MSAAGVARTTMLLPAQAAAAISTSTIPSGVVAPSVWTRMIASPASVISSATTWNGRTRSPLIAIASPIVKNTCVWMTSEARPGVTSPFMAM